MTSHPHRRQGPLKISAAAARERRSTLVVTASLTFALIAVIVLSNWQHAPPAISRQGLVVLEGDPLRTGSIRITAQGWNKCREGQIDHTTNNIHFTRSIACGAEPPATQGAAEPTGHGALGPGFRDNMNTFRDSFRRSQH